MPFNPLKCVYGKFVIPQRIILAIVLHFAMQNAYHLRVVISVAITEMVVPIKVNRTIDDCPGLVREQVNKPKEAQYNWSSHDQGLLKALFFVGYFFGHLPGGWLADKIGARHVTGTCILVSAILNFVMPITLIKGGEYWGFIWCGIIRFIIGLAQGPIVPTISTFIQSWVPKKEKALLGGVAFGGGNLGNIIGVLLTGVIIHETHSWANAFYIWGLLAMAWYVLFLFTAFSYPETHPFITDEEKEFLKTALAKKPTGFKVPWLKILKSCPMWAIVAAQFGHNYVLFVMNTDLPKYVNDYLKMNIKNIGIYSALPFILCWIAVILSGWLGDVLINKKWMGVLAMRKWFTIVSIIVPAFCNIISVYIGCSRLWVIFLFSFGMFWMGPFWPALKINVNDISIHYGGILMAIANGIGAWAGFLGPYLTGEITKDGTLAEWRIIFWIMMGIAIFTSAIYLFFASATRQEWDYWEGEKPEEPTPPAITT